MAAMKTEELAALRGEIDELKDSHPALSEPDLFVLWFVRADLTEDLGAAEGSLTGVSKDKGIDAVYVDENLHKVFIVQGKYRQAGGAEKTSDVRAFANLASDLLGDNESFRGLCSDIDPLVRDRLGTVRNRLKRRQYELELIYATLGSISANLRSEAERRARASGARMTSFGRTDVLRLLENYLDGVAPPIPEIEITINGPSTDSLGELKRIDRRHKVDSWVFSVAGSELAQLYDRAGRRLFARNIRGYLGQKTAVNDAMSRTLDHEPEEFWYFNNGVTMICDEAERVDKGNRTLLRITNPQIINGQQTTRTLAEHPRAKWASVLVRVMALPPDQMHLVTEAVRATNSQNQIKPSDLMSNDRRQVVLERELRKLGYFYLRKRQTKSEARRVAGTRLSTIISKEEVAQATAACELAPEVVRSARERLFDDEYYEKIFSSDDPFYYLIRYWLLDWVEADARGDAEVGYAKFFVLHALWQRVGADVEARSRVFIACSEAPSKYPQVTSALEALVHRMANTVMSFYRAERGAGRSRQSVYVFFKRRGKTDDFEKYLRQRPARVPRGIRDAAEVFTKRLAGVSL